MPERLSVDRARERLQQELGRGRRLLAELDVDEVWFGFVCFGCQRFDTADTPDADGLVLQYGTHSLEGSPVFTLDLARQFEITDASGGHGHYIQLHCELRYEPVPRLRALGHFESWFFHDTDGDLNAWAGGLGRRTFWPVVRSFRPREIRVCQEQV